MAIVHVPQDTEGGVSSFVAEDETKTFFRVLWNGDYNPLLVGCSKTADGYCLFDTVVEEEQVFTANPSNSDILRELTIGGFAATSGSLSGDSVFSATDDLG